MLKSIKTVDVILWMLFQKTETQSAELFVTFLPKVKNHIFGSPFPINSFINKLEVRMPKQSLSIANCFIVFLIRVLVFQVRKSV